MIIIVVHMTWSYHQAVPLHRANVPRKGLFAIFVCYANAFISKKSKKEKKKQQHVFLIELGNSVMKRDLFFEMCMSKMDLGRERERRGYRERERTTTHYHRMWSVSESKCVRKMTRKSNNERTLHANISVAPSVLPSGHSMKSDSSH